MLVNIFYDSYCTCLNKALWRSVDTEDHRHPSAVHIVAGATFFFTTRIAVLMGGGGDLGFLRFIVVVDF